MSNSDAENETGVEQYLEWLNEEIARRSREIEDMPPRSQNPQKSDTKVGINRGLRIARDELIENHMDTEREGC